MSRYRKARKQSAPSSGSLPGNVERMWRRMRTRVESGIFFGDDTWIPLTLEADSGLSRGDRADLGEILDSEPDGWSELQRAEGCPVSSGSHTVDAGGDTWQGGFVSVADSSGTHLLWLLHVTAIDGFTRIGVADGMIDALSEGGQGGLRWRIPLDQPQRLTVTKA
jgi:hypothetical protein